MKIGRQSIKVLSAFRSITSSFILTPTSRFFVFGEGNDREFCSLVIEGRIKERTDNYTVFMIPLKSETDLSIRSDKHADPERKLYFFNQLLVDTKEIASFVINEDVVKEIGKLSRSKPTHIRLWRNSGNYVFARPFDARKYYEILIDEERIKQKLFHLSDFSGESFTVYIEYPIFKQMKTDTYQVSVLSNGILIFDGVETGLTYYTRDQRLGNVWQEEVNDTIGEETVLVFDPRIARQVRHTMKSQN